MYTSISQQQNTYNKLDTNLRVGLIPTTIIKTIFATTNYMATQSYKKAC